MSGSLSEDSSVGRLSERSGQRYQSGEAIAEWRSSEQVENGTPSTSPPYWDINDDDDFGPKPSELYGKFTWKVENFSQITKRELRSNVFDVGGYKWYILIYPQGCDVCNHVSLFLCVANHDKLLPGWSHFAQFTISVINKDQKKTKFSDTLHRFWKKEHDWGWKKFMELSKVLDGFIVDDILEIKAQVQVIRERSDRPFRCLDCQYRRELVRVYLTNVEQICRRFIEDKKGKLQKLILDKARWSSFCTFWLGVEQNLKRRMSREKTDVILKVVVKQFFVEKEVTSTLVMDSLYSGLKALECQSKSKTAREYVLDTEESPTPIVNVENDIFSLVDDVLPLLERAALEPLPPKDEKGPQNRTKDGSLGEDVNKDSIECDERRLTELGRRTVEIFVLTHIYSNRIEVAYQEAVALKRQEELIREEEEAWENEQRTKRGATEKEKKANKKKSKQRRSSRKGKDKRRNEKLEVSLSEKSQNEGSIDREMEGLTMEQALDMLEKPDILEDVSDVTDAADDVAETLEPDFENRDASPANWDTDTSEVHPATGTSSSGLSRQSELEKKSTSIMDDSSSTCSTDSVPSVVMNGPPYKGSSVPHYPWQTSSTRGKNQRAKEMVDRSGCWNDMDNSSPDAARLHDPAGTSTAAEPDSVHSLKHRTNWLEQHLVEKDLEVSTLQKRPTVKDVEMVTDQKKNLVDVDRPSQRKTYKVSNGPTKILSNLHNNVQPKSLAVSTSQSQPFPVKVIPPNSSHQIEKVIPMRKPSTQISSLSKPEVYTGAAPLKPKFTPPEKPTPQQVSAISRPLSAPLVPGPRPATAVVPVVTTTPPLARSLSATGRLGTDASPATQSYTPPKSYKNAIVGETMPTTSAAFTGLPGSAVSSVPTNSQSVSSLASIQMHLPQNSARTDQTMVRPGLNFGSVTPETLHNKPLWMEGAIQDRNLSLSNYAQNRDSYGASGSSALAVQDEFPHLDIINFLLDEEQSSGMSTNASLNFSTTNGYHHPPLNRQFTFPGDMPMSGEASINSSRFHHRQENSYLDDRLQQVYGSSSAGSSYDPYREVYSAVSLPYSDGQIVDGMIENKWPRRNSDFSLLNLSNNPGDGYLYRQLPEYSNLACDVNGYPIFQPANGLE